METAFEISAEKVMDRDPVTATTAESVAQIKNRMEQNGLRAIPLIDADGDFEGAISYRELARFVQFNPEVEAPDRIVHQPPEFEPGDSLVELADLRVNSGRKMLVLLEGDKLAGIVGEAEFMDALENVRELKDVSTGRLAERDLVTVEEDDVLDNARYAMLDNNISRLPVVDGDGKLTGLIDSIDILKMMIKREKQPAGGTSGDRHGREEINVAGGREKEEMSEITVDQLMQENPNTSEEHMTALEAIEKMIDEGEDDIIFVENNYPEAIITLKDMIDYLAGLAQQQTILVQLTGLDLPEEKAVMHNKIKNQLQGSLGRKLEKPEELKVRVRKAEKDGRKHRWELDVQLVSEYGVDTISEEGWELMDTLDEALEELNRIIRDKHDKETDYR